VRATLICWHRLSMADVASQSPAAPAQIVHDAIRQLDVLKAESARLTAEATAIRQQITRLETLLREHHRLSVAARDNR
jgi:hypothetical protein